VKEYRDDILHALAIVAAAFMRNDWELSRQTFWQTCKRANIKTETAQAILEIEYGMDVRDKDGRERTGKKLSTDRMILDKSADLLIEADRVVKGAA
jgi:hypothetical protein